MDFCGFLLVGGVRDENRALGDIGITRQPSVYNNWEWPRSFLGSFDKLNTNFVEY